MSKNTKQCNYTPIPPKIGENLEDSKQYQKIGQKVQFLALNLSKIQSQNSVLERMQFGDHRLVQFQAQNRNLQIEQELKHQIRKTVSDISSKHALPTNGTQYSLQLHLQEMQEIKNRTESNIEKKIRQQNSNLAQQFDQIQQQVAEYRNQSQQQQTSVLSILLDMRNKFHSRLQNEQRKRSDHQDVLYTLLQKAYTRFEKKQANF